VAELARQYELSGGISFRGFVDELRDSARGGQAAEAPIVEEGADGVRLMTVHKAKGLEFPVVILADMTAKIAPMEASRHLDVRRGLCALRIGGWSPFDLLLQQPVEQSREREEGVRVAYVAATRARDLLVVPAIGDEMYEGWVAPLNDALYPPFDRRRVAAPAPACPPFRKDSVMQRPDDEIASARTVRARVHRMDAGGPEEAYDVTWWDPSALRLGVEPPFGLRRHELIAKDVAPEVIAEGQRRYIAWRNGRDTIVAAARVPACDVRTATEWARAEAATAAAPPLQPSLWAPSGISAPPTAALADVIALDGSSDRPAGPRYGTLMHAVLATVPLDADAASIRAIAATQGRIVAATGAEVDSAVSVVIDALGHDVFAAARRAEASGVCFRETPLTVTREGVLVEGVADLAFDDGEGMTVVDFKTDRAEGELLDRYQRQVRLYADAVAQVTGKRTRAVLLKV